MLAKFKQLVHDSSRFIFLPGQAVNHPQDSERPRNWRTQRSCLFSLPDRIIELPIGRVGVGKKPMVLIMVRVRRNDAAQLRKWISP